MKHGKVRISDLILPVSNWNPSASATENFVYVDISSVDASQKRIFSPKTIPCPSAPSRARQLLKFADVLVSTVRPNLNCVAFVPGGLEGAIASTGFCVLRPDKQVLDSRYLFHWVQSNAFIGDMVSKATGASYPAISDPIIHASEIPLPPLEEQRRIAAILDKARSIQDRAEARTEALRSFEESLFTHLFGSAHEQRSRWEWEQFGSLCSRLTVGVVVKPASYYCETGVPALRSLNVKPGQIVETNLVYISEEHNDGILSKSRLSCGDLVFVRSGRPGTCAVIPASLDGCNAIDLLLATINSARILPGFASSYFNSAGGMASIFAESRGQVQQHFNAGSLASALVPVPPIEIQEEFCNALKARNGQLAKSEVSIESLKALSRALEMGLMSGSHP